MRDWVTRLGREVLSVVRAGSQSGAEAESRRGGGGQSIPAYCLDQLHLLSFKELEPLSTCLSALHVIVRAKGTQ